ncbi:MAG: 3-oxoacyl-ACP reductase [Actinomycetota bacterium]|nr:3-oxoacyl-ACP reductase [Actinomycetota bacterium]
MSDRYSQLVNSRIGGLIAGPVGLPQPVELDRYEPGQPLIEGEILLGAAPGGRLSGALARVLAGAGATVRTGLDDEARQAAGEAGLNAAVWNNEAPDADARFKALVFDASGIKDSTGLNQLREFFTPSIRRVLRSGRVVVLGTQPELCDDPREATVQRALEGFTRSVGKEVRRGSTAQLVYVGHGAEDAIDSTIRFLLSPRSAYVSGQVIRIIPAEESQALDWDRPLHGKVALVTGASRGIGASIANVLSRDGAHVVGLDIEPMAADLDKVMGEIGGSSLALDITAVNAPERIAEHLQDEHGGVDIVVHNAGVTRDKTLGNMDEGRWEGLIDINLSSQERINDLLMERELIHPNGRIITVSSISGIAGNAGQTNYATSKAGVIGMVQALAPVVADRGLTINAVAPGFIETAMTAAMPIATREAGRRMNSMLQGGLPVDVAEAIAWYASPASGGVNGNVVRVCGQSLIGA